MRWWERSVSGAAKGQIISMLRRDRHTVEELAASLGVTSNAVRAQLQLLEESGVVRAAGTRQGNGAGKPATVYEIQQSAEPLFSAAYAPVLAALVQSLQARMPPATLRAVLRDTARRLIPAPSNEKRSVEARVHSAAQLLTSLGAELDVEKTETGFRLNGRACPLAAAVRAVPATCEVVEELVETVSGMRARERCLRDGAPRCVIEMSAR